jgi:hypothetical protein
VIRAVLSSSLSCAALCVGIQAARIQASNYAEAGELHRAMVDTDWYARCIGDLKERVERFESDLRARLNAQRPKGSDEETDGLGDVTPPV